MFGNGIIHGFIETARNFAGSFHDPARLTTVQYPEQQLPPQENARTVPFLVYDGDDAIAGLRCTGCTICEQECPPQCISIVKDTAKKPDYLGKMQFFPAVFDIDISVCMGCGICAEVCPFDSIKMDQIYNLCTSDHLDNLTLHKGQLARSNTYYGTIHPDEAAKVDARRSGEKAKAQAKAAAAKPAAGAVPT